MIKGHEFYGNKWFGENHLVDVAERLQLKTFPVLDHTVTGSIIHKYRHGSFETIQNLLVVVGR